MPVKVLVASCSRDLLDGAVRTAMSVSPELPLYVVSEFEPAAGAWIPYDPARGLLRNLHRARRSLAGQSVELALIMLQPRVAHRKLQWLGVLLWPQTILAVNENLDAFELHPDPGRTVLRYIRWRADERRQRADDRRRPATPWRARILGAWFAFRKPGDALAASPIAVAASNRPAGISVVIPSRNGREMLARMLPLVLAEMTAGEVIVVDNGSVDGSAGFLREQFPRVRLLHYSEALAFPVAVNTGVRAARFSHICPLNNDMAVQSGFFRCLEGAFARFPDLFCAAPQVFLPPGLPRQETGKMVLRANPEPSDFPLRSDLPAEGEDLTYVLYGSSGCSLFDADRLLALGGFDEVYQPAYVEDCDLGVRAWQQGWPSVFVADARVIHEHRATMRRLFTGEQLDAMVAVHWLMFLVRSVRDPGLFRRYWRHAIARWPAPEVWKEVGIRGVWRPRREAAALADAEIFALCNGSVTVFPGRAEGPASDVISSTGFPADVPARSAVVCLVDETANVPRELLGRMVELVVVRGAPESFRAALEQTRRKWRRVQR